MPKIEEIVDPLGKFPTLTVESHGGDEENGKEPHIIIKSEGVKDFIIIFPEPNPTGAYHLDKIEINGVEASIEQWRRVFPPILRIPCEK